MSAFSGIRKIFSRNADDVARQAARSAAGASDDAVRAARKAKLAPISEPKRYSVAKDKMKTRWMGTDDFKNALTDLHTSKSVASARGRFADEAAEEIGKNFDPSSIKNKTKRQKKINAHDEAIRKVRAEAETKFDRKYIDDRFEENYLKAKDRMTYKFSSTTGDVSGLKGMNKYNPFGDNVSNVRYKSKKTTMETPTGAKRYKMDVTAEGLKKQGTKYSPVSERVNLEGSGRWFNKKLSNKHDEVTESFVSKGLKVGVGVGVTGGVVLAMSNSRGQQSNQQLYGQY